MNKINDNNLLFKNIQQGFQLTGTQDEANFYKTMFHTLVQNASVGTYMMEQGEYLYVNDKFCKIVGYTQKEFIEQKLTVEDLIHPNDLSIVYNSINKRIGGHVNETRYKVRAVRKDGSTAFVEVHGSAASFNGTTKILGTVIDVTEQTEIERQLEESQLRFKSMFDHHPDATFTFDTQGNFINANPACERLTGYSLNELLDISFMPLIVTEDLPKTMDYFESALNGSSNNFEITITHKSGQKVLLSVMNFPMIVTGQIVGVYGLAKDITKQKQYEEQMHKMAFYDALTELPNRRLFEDRLQQAIHLSSDSEKKLAVFYLDMDRFKFINDSLGHHSGDEFLKLISKRLKNCIRKTDTIARLGGDEFAIIFPRITKQEAAKMAERIVEVLTDPLTLQGHSITVTSSIGIAFNNCVEESAEEFIKKADIAMYETKRNGKNNYTFYTDELDRQASYKLELEKFLGAAVKKEQIELYYQPIIDLKKKTINGIEALIRWNHPKLGLIPPNDFIPIAEENGQIISIGKWVLRTACMQNKQWQDEGLKPSKIAVNVSIKQIQQQNFVKMVSDILTETKLDPTWLELEITESSVMDNIKTISEKLNRLRQLGITISIDDFGTGYTSLIQLKQYSFDKVKIDRHFIKDLDSNANDKFITSAIISLAHNLNMHVVGEGIESASQLSYLINEKCDQGQGYLFSPPLPVKNIRDTLKNGI
jgi:diguanylate cyclase (GGDEF)-like protein/PAS domain S-box-containing protein